LKKRKENLEDLRVDRKIILIWTTNIVRVWIGISWLLVKFNHRLYENYENSGHIKGEFNYLSDYKLFA
jgi:hypothetical protein